MSENDETTTTAVDELRAALLEDVPDDVWASALGGALDAAPDAADDLAGLLPADDGVLDVLEIDDDAFGDDASDASDAEGATDTSDAQDDDQDDDAQDADAGLAPEVEDVLDGLGLDDVDGWDDGGSGSGDVDLHDPGSDL